MTEVERLAVETEVTAAVSTIVTSLPSLAEMLAAATFLASGEWSRVASEMKDGIITTARSMFPGETYQQTADRLGVSPAVVNRAMVRNAVRERESTS